MTVKNSVTGDLNGGKTAISGTPAREEDFSLDPLGNWTDYVQKTSGSTDLDQDRTHNKVNEISDVTETTGTAWITPAHDAAGNMTTLPKPSSPANGLTCKYDAWNRLVQVTDDETVVAKYEYDGLGRRIKKHLDSQSPAEPNGSPPALGHCQPVWPVARRARKRLRQGDDHPRVARWPRSARWRGADPCRSGPRPDVGLLSRQTANGESCP